MLPGVQGTIESIVHSLLFEGGGGARIKSLQTGETIFGSGAVYDQDITITPVDTSKSLILISSTVYDNDTQYYAGVFMLSARFVASDKFRISRGYVYSNREDPSRVRWSVVEFYHGVSVQHVFTSMTLNYTTKDVTISAVDQTKTFLLCTWHGQVSTNNTHVVYGVQPVVYLTSPTNLRLERYYKGSEMWYVVQVVEVKG